MEDEDKQEILIRTVIEQGVFSHKRKYLLQDKVSTVYLVFKNVGASPFLGATISNFSLASAGGQSISHPVRKEVQIPNLNPGEEVKIFIDKFYVMISGPAWISLSIRSLVQGKEVKTYQYDLANESICKPTINSWGDGILVISRQEYGTEVSNKLLFTLTLITTLEAMIGIKKIAIFILKMLTSALEGLTLVMNLLIVVIN